MDPFDFNGNGMLDGGEFAVLDGIFRSSGGSGGGGSPGGGSHIHVSRKVVITLLVIAAIAGFVYYMANYSSLVGGPFYPYCKGVTDYSSCDHSAEIVYEFIDPDYLADSDYARENYSGTITYTYIYQVDPDTAADSVASYAKKLEKAGFECWYYKDTSGGPPGCAMIAEDDSDGYSVSTYALCTNDGAQLTVEVEDSRSR